MRIFFFLSILFFSTQILAQEEPDLPSEQVEVIKIFEAQLTDSEKIPLSPELPDVSTEVKKQQYEVPARTFNLDYPAPRIRPISYKSDEEIPDVYNAYLTAMETPFTAPLNDHFAEVIGRTPVGLILYDMTHDHLLTALAPENPLPIASAFKAGLLMYFVDTVSADVWNSVPVAHWNANASRLLRSGQPDCRYCSRLSPG